MNKRKIKTNYIKKQKQLFKKKIKWPMISAIRYDDTDILLKALDKKKIKYTLEEQTHAYDYENNEEIIFIENTRIVIRLGVYYDVSHIGSIML